MQAAALAVANARGRWRGAWRAAAAAAAAAARGGPQRRRLGLAAGAGAAAPARLRARRRAASGQQAAAAAGPPRGGGDAARQRQPGGAQRRGACQCGLPRRPAPPGSGLPPRGAEALDTCHTHLLERPPHGLAHLHACRPGARWTPWSHVSFLAWCRSEQCTTRMSCWHGLQLWKGARGPCCRRFQVWCCGAQERQAAARRSGSLGAASPDVKPQVRGGMPCAGDLLHSAVPPGVRQSAPGTSGVDLPQPCSRCPGLGGVASRPTCRPPMCLHNTFLI